MYKFFINKKVKHLQAIQFSFQIHAKSLISVNIWLGPTETGLSFAIQYLNHSASNLVTFLQLTFCFE